MIMILMMISVLY